PEEWSPDARCGNMVVGGIATRAACECQHWKAPWSQQNPGRIVTQLLYTTTAFSELPARCRFASALARHVAQGLADTLLFDILRHSTAPTMGRRKQSGEARHD